ncbi:hypothetical protein AQJ84_09550 [Streptomyces resistomycificus]|uniref:DUF6777 domain-containing protein n=3 Tax=Streptomyces resistomycificus TaxID=67356 RepID=A0A0L8LAF5_9ACTN|nr:hypothetical protein ADK37_16460 [Streptomyces resistomycificus]KUN99920.1 hypothetical protein AQJ84_09550 [Streptomyces resistomycificus]
MLVVAAVVLAVVFTRPDGGSGSSAGGSGGGEVFLQAAGKTGPDPFTESSATDSSAPPASAPATTRSAPANAVRSVDGGAPGLYGGTRNVASCDVEKQITALRATPAKNRAFASVAGVTPSEVPAYLRALTPLQLRMDTRVTNHGYRDGAATSYQAVLQSGTAVLVDGRGVPRVRCACGNPLTPPVALQTTPRRIGDSWPSYQPSNVVVVAPAPQVVKVFVIYDPDRGDWFARHPGDTGGKDKKAKPPKHGVTPSTTVSTPKSPSSDSPSPCVSLTGDRTGVGGADPCPSPTSTAPSSPSSSSESPSSSSSQPPSSSSPPPSSESSSPEVVTSEPPSSESSPVP